MIEDLQCENMEALDQRVTFVEKAISDLTCVVLREELAGKMSMSDDEKVAYEQQIKVLRDDFEQERKDRERLASRNVSMGMRLEKLQKEYAELECRLSSVLNNRAYGLSNRPSKLPPIYACDDGSDQPYFNAGMDISPSECRQEKAWPRTAAN